MNLPTTPEDRPAHVRIPSMESGNCKWKHLHYCIIKCGLYRRAKIDAFPLFLDEFNPRKLDTMGSEKGALNRFGLPPTSLDRPQFLPEESRLTQSPIQFRSTPVSTAELSSMQRLVAPGQYLNNNVDMNNQIDVKPTLQHMNAYEAQMGSPNQMGINPSLMTSAAGNRGYPYSNCHI